jgi:integrase/recombinase XerD
LHPDERQKIHDHANGDAAEEKKLTEAACYRVVQVMLGHAQLTSTQVYTQVAIRALKEIHTATHQARLERREEAERIEQARPKRLLKRVYGQKDV